MGLELVIFELAASQARTGTLGGSFSTHLCVAVLGSTLLVRKALQINPGVCRSCVFCVVCFFFLNLQWLLEAKSASFP